MNTNDCVLLFVDQKCRDILAMVLIYKYLTELSVKTVMELSKDFYIHPGMFFNVPADVSFPRAGSSCREFHQADFVFSPILYL
jgi:hypothetical protein